MKYRILRVDGDYDYHNVSWIKDEAQLPRGSIVMTDEEWESRLFKVETAENKKERVRKQLKSSRNSYLFSTDWYTAREIDEPNSYPQAIKDKRILARQEINAIEDPTITLKALNAFNATF
jgi:hypothetical protein